MSDSTAVSAPRVRVRARQVLGGEDSHARVIFGSLAVLGFLAVWELVGQFGLIPAAFIARPTLVVQAGYSLTVSGEIIRGAAVSFQEFMYGFVPAVLAGVALGIAMGRYGWVGSLLDPLVMAAYTTPRIALLPLLIIWFGVGMGSKIAIVFLGAVFPVVVNTIAGIRQIDPVWIKAARSFGCREPDILRYVVLPGALPAVMTGIRLGVGRGIISVIVAEMYVSVAGLGRLMMDYSAGIRTAQTMALVAVVAGFGFVLVRGVYQVERRLGPWRHEQLA